MNPGAGPECKNFATVPIVHKLRILFVARSLKIMALSTKSVRNRETLGRLGQTGVDWDRLGQTGSDMGQTGADMGRHGADMGQTWGRLGQTGADMGQTGADMGQTLGRLGQTGVEIQDYHCELQECIKTGGLRENL